jgi:hypothetical protein
VVIIARALIHVALEALADSWRGKRSDLAD